MKPVSSVAAPTTAVNPAIRRARLFWGVGSVSTTAHLESLYDPDRHFRHGPMRLRNRLTTNSIHGAVGFLESLLVNKMAFPLNPYRVPDGLFEFIIRSVSS